MSLSEENTNFLNPFKDLGERLSSAMAGSKDAMQDLKKSMVKIAQQINASIEQLPESLKLLANQGWYMSMSMVPAEPNYLGDKLKKGHYRKVDQYMMKFIDDNFDNIKNDLCKSHPQRKKVLKSAFKNHIDRDYYASITLFLSQADGICFDYTKTRLYSTKGGVPRISKEINKLPERSLRAIILNPLLEQGLITANENERHNSWGTINRHEILHGLSVDYATKINSYKSISWISYISEMFEGSFRKD